MIKGVVKSPKCLSGGKREAGEFSTGWEIQGRSLGLESWGGRWKVLPPTLRGWAWVCLSGLIGRSPCYWPFSPLSIPCFSSLRTLRPSPLCLPYLQASLITPTHAVIRSPLSALPHPVLCVLTSLAQLLVITYLLSPIFAPRKCFQL